MADEQQTVRGVSWNEVFGFSHIFKSFKMAIHPSKMLLALAAIALTWVLGVFIMDPLWSGVSDSNRVAAAEAWEYWRADSRDAFMEAKGKWLKETRVGSLASLLRPYDDITTQPAKMAEKNFGKGIGELKGKYRKAYEKDREQSDEVWKKDGEQIEKIADKDEQRKRLKTARAARRTRERAALASYVSRKNQLKRLEGQGIFCAFLDWQGHCLRSALSSVRRGNFATGLGELAARRGSMVPQAYRVRPVSNLPGFDASTNDAEGYGLLAWLALMAWGVWWMFLVYPVYTIVYVAAALAIWALLGGAICRIAALHSAREEKISMFAALRFSCSKFVSFLTAPLIPLAGIVFMGLCLALAGLVGWIPYFGEWAYVLLFLLPLIAGAISAFLTVGLVGGAPLMWPTIAAEGSDNFDAFSRSYTYVFARPFRYGLYWVVAAVYGTICYLFVRLFAFIGLRCIHHWSGWTMGLAGKEEYAPGAGKLDVMWAKPTFDSFHGPMQWEVMDGSEAVASVILAAWVYLVSGVVLAFLACFVFSAATNIYFLLRQRVDATDLDDVYVEEPEEEEAAPPAEQPPAEEEPAEEKPAEEAPPEEGESDQDKPE